MFDKKMHDEPGRCCGERSSLARSTLAAAAVVVLVGCASTRPAPLREAPRPTVAAEPLAGLFRSVDDFCRSVRARASAETCGDVTERVEGPKTLAQPEGPFREARLFQVGESAYWHDVVLGIRTDRGWFFPTAESQPDLALSQQLDGPHRIHVAPKRIGIERGEVPVLVFRYLSDEYDSANATDDGSSEGEIRCTVAGDGVPRCASWRSDLGRKGKGALSPSSSRGRFDDLRELHVVDDVHLWVVADGRAYETRDGGVSFVDKTPFARVAGDEYDAHVVWSVVATASEVFVLRGAEPSAPWLTLFVSKDGGASFVERRIPQLEGGSGTRLHRGPTVDSLLVLRYGDRWHGVSVLETRDAGATFRTLGDVEGRDLPDRGAITFQTPTTWWRVGTGVAGREMVFRSTDAGRSWKVFGAASDTWQPISDVIFADALHGFRVVRDSRGVVIERTRDGARSFQRVAPPNAANELVGADREAVVVRTEGGEVLATRDVGASWITLPPFPDATGPDLRLIRRTPHGWIIGARFALRDGDTSWKKMP